MDGLVFHCGELRRCAIRCHPFTVPNDSEQRTTPDKPHAFGYLTLDSAAVTPRSRVVYNRTLIGSAAKMRNHVRHLGENFAKPHLEIVIRHGV